MGKGGRGIYKLIKRAKERARAQCRLIDTKSLHFTEDYELEECRLQGVRKLAVNANVSG